jgi:hypothetical protein
MVTAIIFIGRERYEEPIFRTGGEATMYFLTERLLGKFMGNGGRGTLRNDTQAVRTLQREAGIARFLFENGAPIARPYGVMEIGLHYNTRDGQRLSEKFPCFVQDYEDFPTLNDLDYNLRVEGMVHAKHAVEKLRDRFGLIINRDVLSEKNILFSPTKKEVRLVDFTEWVFEGMNFD